MSTVGLDELRLGDGWRQYRVGSGELRLVHRSGIGIHATSSLDGRVRSAYPVGAHDVELYATGVPDVALLQDFPADLAELGQTVLDADPKRRRVVLAIGVDDVDLLDAARAGGFRYVVDVDIPGEELSLLVLEPVWVTHADADLDKVPTSSVTPKWRTRC